MDTDWCLTCGRRTNEGSEAYCSKTCMTLDRTSVAQSLPIHVKPRRPSFDLPIASPPRHALPTRSQTCRIKPRARTADGFPRGSYNKARFLDDELQDPRPSTFVATTRWSGKDRDGILVWAHAVFPGLEEECASSPIIETTSMPDLDNLFTRPPPFPLTAQNLAPPCVTVAPRHALLNHTSTCYPVHPDNRIPPSLVQDDASFLTPATDSVITPPAPETTSLPSSRPHLSSLISKVCSWIVSPSRGPRATPEGNPTPPSPADDCLAIHSDETARCYPHPFGDKSSARIDMSFASSSHSRRRVSARGGGEPNQCDAA